MIGLGQTLRPRPGHSRKLWHCGHLMLVWFYINRTIKHLFFKYCTIILEFRQMHGQTMTNHEKTRVSDDEKFGKEVSMAYKKKAGLVHHVYPYKKWFRG